MDVPFGIASKKRQPTKKDAEKTSKKGKGTRQPKRSKDEGNDKRASPYIPGDFPFFATVEAAFETLCTLDAAMHVAQQTKDNIFISVSSIDSLLASKYVSSPEKIHITLGILGALYIILSKYFVLEFTPPNLEDPEIQRITRDKLTIDRLQVCLMASYGGRITKKRTSVDRVKERTTKFREELIQEVDKIMKEYPTIRTNETKLSSLLDEHYEKIIFEHLDDKLVDDADGSNLYEEICGKEYGTFDINGFLSDIEVATNTRMDCIDYLIKEPRHAKFEEDCSQLKLLNLAAIQEAMKALSINKLYEHQAKALSLIEQGSSIIVTTPTASGKSLIYQLPTIAVTSETKYCNFEATVIQIFPMKSLANNQFNKLQNIKSHLEDHLNIYGLNPYLYDGDIAQDMRKEARNRGNVLLTNVELLHVSILHNHQSWQRWFKNLKYVVWDELHSYTSDFGVHAALINRRILRIAQLYGNSAVQFICCSATVSRPLEFTSEFLGLPTHEVKLVSSDTSVSAKKLYAIIKKNRSRSLKEESLDLENSSEKKLVHKLTLNGYIDVTLRLLEYFVRNKIRVLCFAKVRKVCEILTLSLKEKLKNSFPGLEKTVVSYRGGYSPKERRNIEENVFSGHVLCIISTNALEIGVDIGMLDVVVHSGYPSSLFSYRQQAGRSGRRGHESASIIVEDTGGMEDRYNCHVLKELVYKYPLDPMFINTEDTIIYRMHLQCMSYENPIDLAKVGYFMGRMPSGTFQRMCDEVLRYDHKFALYHHDNEKVDDCFFFPLRSENEEYWDITTTSGKLLEEMEDTRSIFTIYIGGIFLHKGTTYEIIMIESTKKIAIVREVRDIKYLTSSRDYTNVDPVSFIQMGVLEDLKIPLKLTFGEIRITSRVFGYLKINRKTRKLLESVTSSEDRIASKSATGLTLEIPSILKNMYIPPDDVTFEWTIHALGHLFINSSNANIRTECKHPAATRHRDSSIILYELSKFGQITLGLYSSFRSFLDKSYKLLTSCTCKMGCHRCVWYADCPEGNLAIDKMGAIFLLDYIFS